MTFRSLALSLPLAATTLLVAVPALADEAADTATARSLGVDGVTLANAGNCKEAVEKLDRAEKLHHAPTTATRLGECEIELGKLVRGTERLQRVIREPLPPNTHAAFTTAVARAHKLLETALPRIATLRIAVAAPPGTKVSMTVDDEPTSDAVLDTDRPIDPGTHIIKVSAEGFFTSAVAASLDEGQSKSVSVELRPDPNARRESRSAGGAALAASPTRETPRSKVPAVVAFGLGAVGLGVGIFGAVVTDQKAGSLSSGCDAQKVCPPEMQQDIRDAKTWATVSTAGFVTAGAGAATGLMLLLWSGAGSSNTSASAGVQVRPKVGAMSVGVDGVF